MELQCIIWVQRISLLDLFLEISNFCSIVEISVRWRLARYYIFWSKKKFTFTWWTRLRVASEKMWFTGMRVFMMVSSVQISVVWYIRNNICCWYPASYTYQLSVCETSSSEMSILTTKEKSELWLVAVTYLFLSERATCEILKQLYGQYWWHKVTVLK